jgi:hypothetical protein
LAVRCVAKGKDSPTCSICASLIQPGVVEFEYVVENVFPGCVVELTVSILGVQLAQGPWLASSGFRALGTIGGTTNASFLYSTSIAVSPDGLFIAISSYGGATFLVYSAIDGHLVWEGEEGGESILCSWGKDILKSKILVAEVFGTQILQYTWSGKHLNSISLEFTHENMSIASFACSESRMAIGTGGGISNGVLLMDVNNSEQIGDIEGVWCNFGHASITAIQFSADGMFMVACEGLTGRLSTFSCKGTYMETIPVSAIGAKWFALTSAGDVVLHEPEDGCFSVYSRANGELLRSWVHSGKSKTKHCPFVVCDSMMYVAEDDLGIVVYK